METLENKIKKSKCPFCGKLIKGLWGQ